MIEKYTKPTPKPTEGLVVTVEKSGKTQKINIIAMTDNPADKTVMAFAEPTGIIKLWEGAAYDAIGQWTNADVIAKVTELVLAGTIGK